MSQSIETPQNPAYEPPGHTIGRDENGKMKIDPIEAAVPLHRAVYDADGKLIIVPENVTPTEPATQPAASTAPHAPQPRRSPLRSARGGVAGSMTIEGTRYRYAQLPDSLKEWMEERPQWVAGKLGISLEAFQSDRYVADTPANRAALANMPEVERPEIADAEEVKNLPAYFEEAFDSILEKCLVDCDFPGIDFERDPELKKDLAMEVKAALVAQIGRSTRFGLSQAGFLR